MLTHHTWGLAVPSEFLHLAALGGLRASGPSPDASPPRQWLQAGLWSSWEALSRAGSPGALLWTGCPVRSGLAETASPGHQGKLQVVTIFSQLGKPRPFEFGKKSGSMELQKGPKL